MSGEHPGRRYSGRPRIGVFGGTFDPVHLAHLLLAEWALESLQLERMLFVPACVAPHKQDATAASGDDRVQMLRRAVEGNPRFDVSTIELDRGGVSYTVDTLDELRRRDPDAGLVLLMGSDSARDFPTWHRPRQIAALADVAVFARAEADLPDELIPGVGCQRVEAPLMAISSTLIRNRRRSGQSIRYLTPDRVVAYIEKHGLYQR